MNNRRRSPLEFLRKKIARRFLKKISRAHIKTNPQLVVFSFDFIAQSIAIDGRFETNELSLIQNLFTETLKDKVVLDIGANIGNHAVALSKIAKKVYAFEPNPVVFELLKINTNNHPNIQIFPFGVSDKDEKLTAHIPVGNYGAGSVSAHIKTSRSQHKELVFELRTLDQLPDITQQDIGLVKIDVEGHELKAFMGMAQILKKNKPVILFEQNRGIENGTSQEIDFLKSLGYKKLYTLNKIDDWVTPKWIPKPFQVFFKLIEVCLIGEPSNSLKLSEIEHLKDRSYDMLVFSHYDLI